VFNDGAGGDDLAIERDCDADGHNSGGELGGGGGRRAKSA